VEQCPNVRIDHITVSAVTQNHLTAAKTSERWWEMNALSRLIPLSMQAAAISESVDQLARIDTRSAVNSMVVSH
jgi:hypothetical protein